MGAPPIKYISPQEYLKTERESPIKHQYLDGEVVAMAGATLAHNYIVANILREIGSFLKGKSCRITPSESPHKYSISQPLKLHLRGL
jgi:Uma2 family endonuclease